MLPEYCNFIINNTWYSDKRASIEDESLRIIETAAKIIHSDIRNTVYNMEHYPSESDIKSTEQGWNFIPQSLLVFLKALIPSELKQVSTGQCIVKAARPRSSLPPVLFGLAVELDHIFGSKCLLNELSRLGFSISYSEVTRYKQSVVLSTDVEDIQTE